MAGIFISYRRGDSAGWTGRLVDDLGDAYGADALFRDIEAIEAGEDFVDTLDKAVAACSVMLVVVGPQWASITSASGRRRLEDPQDFVRLEVEAALARGIRVIPVLVGDAAMPDAGDLPGSLAAFARRQAHPLSDRRWGYDVEQLLAVLDKVPNLPRRRGAGPTPAAAAETSAPPAPSPPATAAAAPRGMALWLKLVLGAGGLLALLVVLVLAMPPEADPAAPAAATTPAPDATPPPVAALDLSGMWRDLEDVPYRLDQSGSSLGVVAGNQAGEGAVPAAVTYGLAGEGTIDGERVTMTLVKDTDQSKFFLDLSVQADGSLAGTARRDGGDSWDLVLRRQ